MAEETPGACFNLFKYCYDTMNTPIIKYGESENEYTNLKEFDEDVLDPKPIGKTNSLG